jgi:pyrroloquinoline quinone biosynthesis protein B
VIHVKPQLILLGTAQDGGYPQVGCTEKCCDGLWNRPKQHRLPCSLGIIDSQHQKRWLIDCTPNFPQQWARLNRLAPSEWGLGGIFLTHAHMGHYTGLLHLGKEGWGTKDLPIYVMPRMKAFLQSNAPWNALIDNQSIQLIEMSNRVPIPLTNELEITPILVPHRDEYTETVGFILKGEHSSALYISDIDHWHDPELDITSEIEQSDIAWLDGTFYSTKELPHRDRSQIPHPTIAESMQFFSALSSKNRKKIHFFHLNHSNPLCNSESEEFKAVLNAGYEIAVEEMSFSLD